MRTVYLLSLWLHVVAAGVWIGSMVFLGAVIAPVMRRLDTTRSELSRQLWEEVGRRYRIVGWMSLALLFLTGTINIGLRGYRGSDWIEGTLFAGSFGRTLLGKLLLVALLVGLTLWHERRLGSQSLAYASPEEWRRWRRQAAYLGWGMLLLSLLIAGFGLLLARGGFSF